MIDDQKIIYEKALALAKSGAKHVLIVEGGPGTGKSVVAVNLLVALTNLRKNSFYVTKNAAPRAVYDYKLTGEFKKTRISNLFCGSGQFVNSKPNSFDALIIDEAHRLNEKSGMMQNLGENQIKEIISAAWLSVFFLDEDQRVTLKDIGRKAEIEKWAKKNKAEISFLSLSSQFRCNGSDDYLAWLDNTLQKRETSIEYLYDTEFDVKVIDSPNELRDIIFEKNKEKNKARLVAGYCWDWISKKNPKLHDIRIPEYDFSMRWNLSSDGSLWILKPDSVREVGCIHTCQGLELDYIGVIVGPDLIYRSGKILTDPSKRARTDASIKGYKRLQVEDPQQAFKEMDTIIKNTYKTLMTRGMLGCYLYFTDRETAEYFKSKTKKAELAEGVPNTVLENIVQKAKSQNIIEISVDPAYQYMEYLPFYGLEAACGRFGMGVSAESLGWIKVEKNRKLDRNMFVARVTGRSMEPRIKDGDYCIFRTNVVGSRNNKIVLVQHNSISDPETGGKYTVKKYSSRKKYSTDGTWTHEEIILLPLNPNYSPLTIMDSDEGEFMVIAEFLAVI